MINDREIAFRLGDVGVAGRKYFLADGERAEMNLLRLRKTLLVCIKDAEIIQDGSDIGMFGRSYRIALQAGDRGGMAKGLWAESFRVSHRTFERFSPGDRITVEYSPRLRYVFDASTAERTRLAG